MSKTHESWAIGSNKMGVHPVRKHNFNYGYEKGRDFGTTKYHMQDGPITVFKNELKVDEMRNKKNDSNVYLNEGTASAA